MRKCQLVMEPAPAAPDREAEGALAPAVVGSGATLQVGLISRRPGSGGVRPAPGRAVRLEVGLPMGRAEAAAGSF